MSVPHTPGPWLVTADEDDEEGYSVTVADALFDTVAQLTPQRKDGEELANARLIAAAPDLLELARQYASECAECGGDGTIEAGENIDKAAGMIPERQPCPDCAGIRAVIAKAEGAP